MNLRNLLDTNLHNPKDTFTLTEIIYYDRIIKLSLSMTCFYNAKAKMKLSQGIIFGIAIILFFSSPALGDTSSLGGNPIIGFKLNTSGASASGTVANPVIVTTLLSEIFIKNQKPFTKNFYNEYNSFVTRFRYKGFLLEFVDFDSSNPTRIAVTSFFDDPNTSLRSTSKDTIQNTTAALSLARVKVEVKGDIVKFGPWQGYSVHILDPQDGTSPPPPDSNTVFSEDWQDTTLQDGLVINKFLGAKVSIRGGYLTVWGDYNSYIVLTIPSNVLCLAMYGVDVTEEFVPSLGRNGVFTLMSLLIIFSVIILYHRRQRAANRSH